MNETQPGSDRSNPSQPGQFGYDQVEPDSTRFDPNNSGHAGKMSGPVPAMSGPDPAEPELLPSEPFTISAVEAFETFHKERLIKNPRTVTRWCQSGSLDARQDPQDRNKYWINPLSIEQKLEELRKRRERQSSLADVGLEASDLPEGFEVYDDEKIELIKEVARLRAKLDTTKESKKDLIDVVSHLFDRKIEKAVEEFKEGVVAEFIKIASSLNAKIKTIAARPQLERSSEVRDEPEQAEDANEKEKDESAEESN